MIFSGQAQLQQRAGMLVTFFESISSLLFVVHALIERLLRHPFGISSFSKPSSLGFIFRAFLYFNVSTGLSQD